MRLSRAAAAHAITSTVAGAGLDRCHRRRGVQGQWFSSLVAYLKASPAMGWTYWALNGEDSYARRPQPRRRPPPARRPGRCPAMPSTR